MKNIWPCSLLLVSVMACRTSGDVAKTGPEEDPSGVVTVEAPPEVTPTAAPAPAPTAQAHPPGDNMTRDQELAVLKGKLEDSQVTAQRERDALNARIKELEDQNHKLQEGAQRTAPVATTAAPAPGTETPKGANGAVLLWQAAQKDMKAGDNEKALAPLGEIVKTYPKNELALPALVNIGVIQYQIGKYNDAAITFNSVIDKYPKKKETALAWFGQAAAFAKLKQKDESKLVFEEVVNRYPGSAEAKSAKSINSKKETVPNSLFALASKYRSLRM